jgi:hypothetical protein
MIQIVVTDTISSLISVLMVTNTFTYLGFYVVEGLV